MMVVASPLLNGHVAINMDLLRPPPTLLADELKKLTDALKIDLDRFRQDTYTDHLTDALRYSFEAGARPPAPPEPDPSWSAEAQAAHKALHAELPQYAAPSQHGFVDAQHYYRGVPRNEDWMAAIETEAAHRRRSAWEKLKGWINERAPKPRP